MNRPDLDTYFARVVQRSGFTAAGGRFYLERIFQGIDFTGKRMLDIGGGRGAFSYYAGCRGAAEVICLEPQGAGSTADMNQTFRALGAELGGMENVRLVADTIQNYDPGEGRFDIVLSHASINHLDEEACIRLHRDSGARATYHALFRKIADMCNPGAELIACDVSRVNFFGLLGVANPFAPCIAWHKHQPPSVWAALLAEAGFSHPRVTWGNRRRRNAVLRGLLNNAVAEYFQGSQFCLRMRRG
jgi:2-polyprenyl-3-methyl-5-hydroxy-6-metoxy-1,4-benzoquinol methylase